MIGELLTTALVPGVITYLLHVTGDMTDNPLGEIAETPLLNQISEEYFLSTDEYASFRVIGAIGVAVVEVYSAPPEARDIEYQPSEDIVRAYAVPLTIPETGQFGLFGDDRDGQFFEIEPGTYQVIAEARYLQKEELAPYAEVFPRLNRFIQEDWDSDLRNVAPELWRLTFIPTEKPVEAVELHRRLTFFERRRRGLP